MGVLLPPFPEFFLLSRRKPNPNIFLLHNHDSTYLVYSMRCDDQLNSQPFSSRLKPPQTKPAQPTYTHLADYLFSDLYGKTFRAFGQ